MTSVLSSVTLSLALLASLFLVSLFNLKVIKPTIEALTLALKSSQQAEAQRAKVLTQALNLLATKDPLAYQLVQASTPEPKDFGMYNGPYVTGEEYQQLLDAEERMAKLWKSAEEGFED